MIFSLLNTPMRDSATSSTTSQEPTPTRFLSSDQCRALADRIFRLAGSEGDTFLNIYSYWRGNVRWGRNVISSGGDTQATTITISRSIRGASGAAITNAMDDAALKTCIALAESQIIFRGENPEEYPDIPPEVLPTTQPKLWYDSSYNLDATARSTAATPIMTKAEAAHFLSAGYVSVSGSGNAVIDSNGLFRYYPYTTAQYSVTVRDRRGTGSGWAGIDWNDWDRVDTAKLSTIALDKCTQSRNPVAIEPGRYDTILEPQAMCDLFAPILDRAMSRRLAEAGQGPFAAGGGNSKIGQQLLDERITISADPMDPDCGFVPFDWGGEPYQHVNWFDRGVLKELQYDRRYGLTQLGKDAALSNSRAFRMSGGTTTREEMISTTKRGILVTRFNSVMLLDFPSMLLGGNTRDGLWLIENGKISKAIKNFRFTESPLFILNNIVQLGVPQRVFRPGAPAVVPLIKVHDFSFTGLMDAV